MQILHEFLRTVLNLQIHFPGKKKKKLGGLRKLRILVSLVYTMND